jgi:hypothetical protein
MHSKNYEAAPHTIFPSLLLLPLKTKHSHQHPAFKQLSGGKPTGSFMYTAVTWSSRLFCGKGGPKYRRIQTDKGKLCGKVELLKAEIPNRTE